MTTPAGVASRIVLTLGMTVASLFALRDLDRVGGDWTGLLWVSGAYFLPFLSGIALGPRWRGRAGVAMGALLGALIAAVPTLILWATDAGIATSASFMSPVLSGAPGPAAGTVYGRVLLVFVPLAAVQGAIAVPTGARARRERREPATGTPA